MKYTVSEGQMDALALAIMGEPDDGDPDKHLRAVGVLVALGVITPCDHESHDRGELGCDLCRPLRAGWKFTQYTSPGNRPGKTP